MGEWVEIRGGLRGERGGVCVAEGGGGLPVQWAVAVWVGGGKVCLE